jgi:hypothetical protein
MKYFKISFLIGLILTLYSFSLDAYTDINLFNTKYMNLNIGQSKEYYELRQSMLTPKYYLQDIGILLILISSLFFLFKKLGKNSIKTPNLKIFFILLALFLPIITTGGFVFDLMQAMSRGEFPHWGDSLSIPLMGVPIIFVILLLWSCIHLIFIYECNIVANEIKFNTLKKLNKWLLFLIAISLLITIDAGILGQYWYAIPGLLWIYYYISLATVRYNKYITPQTNKSNQETKQ